jgi:two-component system cell cycle response regulator
MVISERTDLEIEYKKDFPRNFVKKDGTEISLSVSTSVQLLEGEQRGLIVTLKDLSELQGLFITPVSEVDVKAKMKYHLEQGFMYLIEEEKPEKSFDVFTNSVKHGCPGLFISRQKTALIREKYQLEKTPNIWLTRNKVPEENCISPDELAKLYKTLEGFIRQADDGIIFFEGLEYLIAQNGFQPVLKFIQSLNDLIMVHPSRLIVAVDPLTMDTRELHIVRRDMRTI